MNYDLIGDIHGHADALERLLRKLGYTEREGSWTPPGRTQAVFLGDFIDRGPDNRRVLEIVRSMIDQGVALAVMGNHEYNAIGFWPHGPNGPLRKDICRTRKQHKFFLREYEQDPEDWQEVIAFFHALPLCLEFPEAGLRVVHACWSSTHIAQLRAHPDVSNCRMTPAFMQASAKKGSPEHEIIEILLKGPEVGPPAAVRHTDEDGIERTSVRYRWWGDGPHDSSERLLGLAKPSTDLKFAPPVIDCPRGEPVFFGHYWWEENHGSNVGDDWACLDLSVAKGGSLACYRWREGQEGQPLSSDSLVWVSASRRI